MPEHAKLRTIDAHVVTTLGQISAVRERWETGYEHCGRTSVHHLQLSLLPFPEHGQCCFPDDWSRNRFEPIGKLFLLPAERTVHTRTKCPEQKSVVYHFDDEAICQWFEEGIHWNPLRLERCLSLNDPEVIRLMRRIGQELRSPGFASETLIELMAAEVLIALARQIHKIEAPQINGGLAPWRLRLVDNYVEAHLGSLSLPDLARECQLSVRQLSRAFQISRGCSLGNYIAQQRMEEARRRLAAGYAVKEVAKQVGFNSASNFSTAFRRMTGETPRHAAMRMAN